MIGTSSLRCTRLINISWTRFSADVASNLQNGEFAVSQGSDILTPEQIVLLKNPPASGPFHEVSLSQQKLIDDGYLARDPSREFFQLTERGQRAVDWYDHCRQNMDNHQK